MLIDRISRGLSAGLVLAALALSHGVASASDGEAVVPERVIYPGETITPEMLRIVPVLNPNIGSGYASDVAQVSGLVTTRTLLPGRTIPVKALREAWAVERGKTVELVFAANSLTIIAQGTPLENAATGQLIRVRNIESGVIVSGTVMDDGTVRVVTK